MKFIEPLPDWTVFNRDLCARIRNSCHELIEKHFPRTIYEDATTPVTANGRIFRHSGGHLDSHYFLFALDEVEKSCLAVEEMLMLEQSDFPDVLAYRNKLQRVFNEQTLRLRSLSELLVFTTKFAEIGSDATPYLKHFCAYKTYDYLQKNWNECRQNYDSSGMAGKNAYEEPLNSICDCIDNVEQGPGFDFSCVWYLAAASRVGIFSFVTKGITYPSVSSRFLDFGSLLNSFLRRAANSGLELLEKACLGFTYQGLFGSTSQDIHFNPHLYARYFVDPTEFQRSIFTMNLLSAAVACRCSMLTTGTADGPSQQLFDYIAGPTSHPFFEGVFGTPTGQIGDYLSAKTITTFMIGEVLNVSVDPRTGYVLYEVRPFADYMPSPPPMLVPATDVLDFYDSSKLAGIHQRLAELQPLLLVAPVELVFLLTAGQDYELLSRTAELVGGLKVGCLRMQMNVSVAD